MKELLTDIALKYLESYQLIRSLGELRPTKWYFSIGDPGWDGFLEGGISIKGLNEIVGPGGAGKTQVCLQLALSSQLPTSLDGLNGSKLNYVCIHSFFPKCF